MHFPEQLSRAECSLHTLSGGTLHRLSMDELMVRAGAPHAPAFAARRFVMWAARGRKQGIRAIYIVRNATGAECGAAWFSHANATHRSVELGVWLLPDAMESLAEPVLRLLLDCAFADPALHRVHIGVDASDTAIVTLCEQFGMVPEGRCRQVARRNGAPADVLCFSLLATDTATEAFRGHASVFRGEAV